MKKYIQSSYDEYKPEPLSPGSAQEILDRIEQKILSKYENSGSMIDVDFTNLNFKDNYISVDVTVYRNGRAGKTSRFIFTPWSEYWDEGDYIEHLDRTIIQFLQNYK